MGTLFHLAWLPLLICGCSSMFTVKSLPLQADVYVHDAQSGEKKSLGKTPLEVPVSTLKETAGDTVMAGQFFTVSVEKQGFITEKLSIPATRFGTLVTALDVKLKEGNNAKEERHAQDLLNRLFLAQKFSNTRQYDRAQLELDKILTENPNFSRALSMRGSIYFMQKNYAESLKWYEEALKVDPQMEDVVQMVSKVRTLSGSRGKP